MRLGRLAPRSIAGIVTLLLALGGIATYQIAHAAATTPAGDFSIEVSPSTLAGTVKPGVTSRLELKIHNVGAKAENLKIETRSFTMGTDSADVKLSDTTPPDLARWVSFARPAFTIAPGEWYTQEIAVQLPEEAGFSYPFAVVISRADNQATASGGRLIKGSVAVFALMNVDKPGATRTLGIKELKTSQSVYEFLPSRIDMQLANTGNSIVQPYGNVYLQRKSNDTKPISVLPLNEERGYVLPDKTRSFSFEWTDGFPAYKTVTKNGKETKELVWDWSNVSHLRIGRYTANVVAVYNDGYRDVPVIGETSFWVIPWRILFALFIVLALIGFGIWSVVRGTVRTARRILPRNKPPTD